MGTIKKIKLLVTDFIRSLYTIMSALRGGVFLKSLGQHCLRANRLNRRRIVSLGLTSLCQVTMKKRALLDTSALPVNKFDLSGVGILSPTLSALFSTEALSLLEDESELAASEDAEGVLSKCHTFMGETIIQVLNCYSKRDYTTHTTHNNLFVPHG